MSGRAHGDPVGRRDARRARRRRWARRAQHGIPRSLALELDGAPGISALAADTDGIDGHGDHAGGIVVPETLQLGAERGLVAGGRY